MAEEQAKEIAADLGLDTEYPVTEEQIRSLHENSWARLPGLLSAQAAAVIVGRLASEQVRTGTAAQSYRKGTEHESAPVVVASNISHEAMAWRDPFFRAVATSKRLASAAVTLMRQPAALLAQDISFIKPGGGGPTNPHQDYSYLPFDRWGELTIWIALVDISADMGPLYYLESSHREGPLGLHHGNDIRDQHPYLFERKIVGGEPMAAGDAQVHWDLTIHGAVPNATDNPRAAYVCRYLRTDTHYSGVGHPHFDSFGLTPGSPFADSGKFPLVGPNGLIDG